MDDAFKLVLTVVSAGLGGISIYMVGKLIERLVIEPMIELRRVLGEIDAALIYYADVCNNPIQQLEEMENATQAEIYRDASRMLRQKAADLSGRAASVTCYGLFVPAEVAAAPLRRR